MKRRYDRRHRRVRAKYATVVKAGNAVCARCGKPIAPNELWDLDHDDEDPLQRRYLGPSHRPLQSGGGHPLEGGADP